jgi:hypothetical protein
MRRPHLIRLHWPRLHVRAGPIVLGLIDGITNALGLSSGSILRGGSALGLGLSLRVATFALATAAFAIFVAQYVDLRFALIGAAKHLNLLKRGALATTRLGRAARRNALADAAQASTASFAGALLPLAVAVAFPGHAWLALVIAVGMLALLGVVTARRIQGNAASWAAGLALAGIIIIGIGAELNIA